MPRPPTSLAAGNRLLAALESGGSLAGLNGHAQEVRLERHQTLGDPESPITRVYFPQDGLVSLLTCLGDGTGIETAIIGREGLLGLPLVAGHRLFASRAIVQAPGRALAIEADAFEALLRENEPLRLLLGRYLHAFLTQIFQNVACNAVHSAEQRMARWLLSAADRNGGKPVPLTHEFLAEMLGLGRPTVSLVAGALQDSGCIRYRRGLIEVADAGALAKAACECYGAVRRTYSTLLPLSWT